MQVNEIQLLLQDFFPVLPVNLENRKAMLSGESQPDSAQMFLKDSESAISGLDSLESVCTLQISGFRTAVVLICRNHPDSNARACWPPAD